MERRKLARVHCPTTLPETLWLEGWNLAPNAQAWPQRPLEPGCTPEKGSTLWAWRISSGSSFTSSRYSSCCFMGMIMGNGNPVWLQGLSLNLGIWIAYYAFCLVILPCFSCIFWSCLLISVKHILGHAVSLAYTGDAVLHVLHTLYACKDSHV